MRKNDSEAVRAVMEIDIEGKKVRERCRLKMK